MLSCLATTPAGADEPSQPTPVAFTARTGSGYWCLPTNTTSGTHVGYHPRPDTHPASELDGPIWIDTTGRDDRDESWPEHQQDTPDLIDLGDLGDLGQVGIELGVRIGDDQQISIHRLDHPDQHNRFTAQTATNPTWQQPCRVSPTSTETRPGRDNSRWGCVGPEDNTSNAPTGRRRDSGGITLEHDGWDRDNRTRPDHTDPRPGHRSWPLTSTPPANQPTATTPSTPRPDAPTPRPGEPTRGQRCVILWPGNDGIEIHPGQLTRVSPER